MFKRLAAVLLLSAMLAGTSQAFTINLAGTMSLISGTAGSPPGFLGLGSYAYTAMIQAAPPNTSGGNPTLVTAAWIDLTSAGLPGPMTFGGGTVAVTAPDTVVANVFGGPDGSTLTFTFVNPNANLAPTAEPDNDSIRMVINDPAVAITTTGSFWPGAGPPDQAIVGGAVSTAVAQTPEPSSFALLGAIAVGGVVFHRRKRTKAA